MCKHLLFYKNLFQIATHYVIILPWRLADYLHDPLNITNVFISITFQKMKRGTLNKCPSKIVGSFLNMSGKEGEGCSTFDSRTKKFSSQEVKEEQNQPKLNFVD